MSAVAVLYNYEVFIFSVYLHAKTWIALTDCR